MEHIRGLVVACIQVPAVAHTPGRMAACTQVLAVVHTRVPAADSTLDLGEELTQVPVVDFILGLVAVSILALVVDSMQVQAAGCTRAPTQIHIWPFIPHSPCLLLNFAKWE